MKFFVMVTTDTPVFLSGHKNERFLVHRQIYNIEGQHKEQSHWQPFCYTVNTLITYSHGRVSHLFRTRHLPKIIVLII
jgi:hypothetical protein